MVRKDWIVLGGFIGTILTILVVFFTGLQTMNSRFEAIDSRFEAIDNRFVALETYIAQRLQVIDRRIYEMNTRLSRIEGHLGIPATVPDRETPPVGPKE